MYHFERGKDPKDTLEVGAKKDAIKITGIAYVLDDKEIHIENPMKAKVFLDRLRSGDLPNDPIFGIESVFVWHDEKDMEEDWESKFNKTYHSGMSYSSSKKYKEVKNTETYELGEIQGKVLDICGKLILFPTLEELEKAGFGYLDEYLEGENMVREEDLRIEQYLMKREEELREEDMKEERQRMAKELLEERKRAKEKTQEELEESQREWEVAKKSFADKLKGNFGIFNSGNQTT
jgi:hypothetical protein